MVFFFSDSYSLGYIDHLSYSTGNLPPLFPLVPTPTEEADLFDSSGWVIFPSVKVGEGVPD